jgi:VIT1/CCC1 family predicted Fe2+/Mn2+ transporter
MPQRLSRPRSAARWRPPDLRLPGDVGVFSPRPLVPPREGPPFLLVGGSPGRSRPDSARPVTLHKTRTGAPRAALRSVRSRLRSILAAPASPHETRGSSILRPSVFGATDGLVANVSLIMGVAGASSGNAHTVIVAGIAGLMAGSFSMAVGEYISVRSQRELLDYQVELERQQLRRTPEHERAILIEIYESRGLSRADATFIVDRLLAKPRRALDTFVRDEIGLSAKTMGSPITAAAGSLLAFALGAFVPLAPFLLLSGAEAFALAVAVTLGALFLVGLGVSRLTHRHPFHSGLRQAALGLLAATATYGIGAYLGTAVR